MSKLQVSVFNLCFLILTCNFVEISSRECLELTEFECNDGTCIKKEKVCNDKKDCQSGEDEENCSLHLCEKPNWYLCSDNNTCIGNVFLCDGTEQCPNGDDEDNCEKLHEHPSCNKFEFTCKDKTCIPLDLVCDGKQDCHDKSDETIGCTDIEKKCKGFLCKNKLCLESHSWVCDGYDDCGDGSDEVGCVNNCKLEDHKFLCKDKDSCITIDKVCDDKDDCADGSDEHNLCHSSKVKCNVSSCKLPSKCHMLPSGATCICPKGFFLNLTLNRCVDINECDNFGVCSQGCNNTLGSYNCTCIEKFVLKRDGRTCEVKNSEPLLLYTTLKTVVGVYLKSRHVYEIARNLSQVVGVSYDGLNIYWTDIKQNEESIIRAHIDGSKQENILTSGLEAPEDLAVDWLTGNIYFTDNLMKHIAVCSNDGYICTSLVIDDVDHPRGIVLYPEKGIMFWTDWGKKPMIAKASMDGSNPYSIISTEIHWPNGLALDSPNGRIYWVDAKLSRIESSFLDGSDRRVILNEILKHPYGIAVFEDKIYWSDWITKSIHSCHKFTGKHHEVLVKDRTIYDLHIYHSATQPKIDHPCLAHKCSHLCLLAANNSSSCACPEGMTLGIDYLTCKKTTKHHILYLGIGNYLVEMEHTSFGRHKAAESLPLPFTIHKMAFNVLSGTIFIADNNRKTIFEFNPNNKTYSRLVDSNIRNISALSFDHLANNLYWSDSEQHTIEVISLNNRKRAIVQYFSGGDVPISMVVVPEAGKLFIALKSEFHTHIDVQFLHGRGNHHHVVEDKIGSGHIELYVDFESETVFWLDTESGKIEFTNYEGNFRHLLRSQLALPSSMTTIGEDIMWSSYQSSNMYWTHKSNLGSIKKFELEKPLFLSFPDHIPIISSKPLYVVDHKCQHNNGGCSDICVSMGKFKSACLCPPELVFKNNENLTCIDALDCEFRCNTGECLTSSRRCNGRKDCVDGSDEVDCKDKGSNILENHCTYDQFSCHDGTQCISNNVRCDKVFDCDDKSDEDDCDKFDHTKKCREHQYVCDNGRCVDFTSLCDSFNDCGDRSDEKYCDKFEESKILCGKNMFTCVSGQCIPKKWECDGHMDCVDGSDEHGKCDVIKCQEGTIKCKMGQCIDEKLICDGHNDCGDNSDEIDCAKKQRQIVCGDEKNNHGDPKKFQCQSDLTKCFDISVKCNGTAECPRGEDEVGCSGCSFYEFKCQDDNVCIRNEFRCDKQKDCSDGSDEINCQHFNISLHNQFATVCKDDMFDCGDNTCIEQLRVCDGISDCKNDEDESEFCKTACSNSPCEQKCSPSPHGAICSCKDGYRLSSDKKSCEDINECIETNPCAQTCENTDGSYRCGCFGGFLLRSDKTSCKSMESEHYLLFSSYDQIRKLSENPLSLKIMLSTNDSKLVGMDVNVKSKKVYFTLKDKESLFEYDIDSKNIKEFYNDGKKEKLAVDWVTGNIYVIDYSNFYSIKVCNFEKSACSRIMRLSNRDTLKSLVIDAVNRVLFYAVVHFSSFDIPQTKIYKAGLDGSRRKLIVSKSIYASALECDSYKKLLYFIDLHSKTLQSVGYEGGSIKTIIRRENTIINPAGVAIFENVAFIINTGSPEAVRCNLFGNGNCKAFNLNVYNAEDIVVFASSRQKDVLNVCESNRCSLICVQAELGSKCLCEEGQLVESDVLCSGIKNNATISNKIEKSSNATATVFLVLLILTILLFCGYIYYRRRHNRRNFNINMHFQNPLSRIQVNESENNESSRIKFFQPIQRLLQDGRISEVTMITKQEDKLSTFNEIPGNSRNITQDSDDDPERNIENFKNDNSWSRLVK